MADGAAIAGGAAAGAQVLPALFGRGKSNFNAQDISHSPMYDPNANQFGAYGAENYKEGREQQARAIDQRTAFQANYQQADADRQRALDARGGQAQAQQLMMNRATGATPSIAQMQADRQMGQAAAQQGALAASARGRGALANAATTAAANTANAQGAISNQAQINAANERMQAEQAAFGASSAMRGQDYQGQGQAANQAQFQAGMQAANRAANDSRAMGYAQMGHQALGAEQQGAVQMQGIAAQSQANAQAQNAATERQNAENKGLFESIGDFFSDMRTKETSITSDFTAKLPAMSGAASGASFGGAFGKTPLPSLAGGGGATTSTWGGGGMDPLSGPAEASSDVLTSGGGGMDVMGSIQKHANYGTRFVGDPTSGMTGGIVSDDRAKLKAAFEHGAAYADADHAGKPIPPPDYATEEKTRNPAAGPAPSKETKIAEEAHAARVAAAKAAAQMPAQRAPQAPPSFMDSTRQLANSSEMRRLAEVTAPFIGGPIGGAYIHRNIPQGGESITSDFSAKEPLKGGGLTRDAYGNPGEGDENAPKFGFDPKRGWFDPSKEPTYSKDLDEAMKSEADEPGNYADDAYWNAKLAEQRRKDAASMAANEAWNDEPMADDGKRMAPGTNDFQKTEPKEGGGGPAWWQILGTAGKGLNEAQFGRSVRSDRRAKNVIDLDAVDVDNDPGAQDFDADEYLESKAPKPRSFEELHMKRDTPADQKAVKRGVEDRAGKDADNMMASMRANLGKGSAVDERVAASLKPSDSPVAQANRTMRGEMYTYKPQFTPPEQKPGEPNFGFMAQNLEKSPITATAVKEDPNGLKRVDALKLLRVLGASVADLQEQQDETRLALKGGKRGAARGR